MTRIGRWTGDSEQKTEIGGKIIERRKVIERRKSINKQKQTKEAKQTKPKGTKHGVS